MSIVRTCSLLLYCLFFASYTWNIEQTNQKTIFLIQELCKFVIRNQNHERWNFLFCSVYCKLHVMSAKVNIVPTLLLFRFSYCYAICLHVHRRMTYIICTNVKGKKKEVERKKKCLTISVTLSFRSAVVFYLHIPYDIMIQRTKIFFLYGLCCFVHTICMPPTGSGKQKSSFMCVIFFQIFWRCSIYPHCRFLFFNRTIFFFKVLFSWFNQRHGNVYLMRIIFVWLNSVIAVEDDLFIRNNFSFSYRNTNDLSVNYTISICISFFVWLLVLMLFLCWITSRKLFAFIFHQPHIIIINYLDWDLKWLFCFFVTLAFCE